jgi:hypothetical protein
MMEDGVVEVRTSLHGMFSVLGDLTHVRKCPPTSDVCLEHYDVLFQGWTHIFNCGYTLQAEEGSQNPLIW